MSDPRCRVKRNPAARFSAEAIAPADVDDLDASAVRTLADGMAGKAARVAAADHRRAAVWYSRRNEVLKYIGQYHRAVERTRTRREREATIEFAKLAQPRRSARIAAGQGRA